MPNWVLLQRLFPAECLLWVSASGHSLSSACQEESMQSYYFSAFCVLGVSIYLLTRNRSPYFLRKYVKILLTRYLLSTTPVRLLSLKSFRLHEYIREIS